VSIDPLVARRRHEEMRAKFGKRDANMMLVKRVRAGEMHEIPEMAQYFSDDLPRATTANTVKVAAEDMANVMGALPALACASGNGITQADQRRAEKKNKIGWNYWMQSRLDEEFTSAADHYNSYGIAVLCVEPAFERRIPLIRVENPEGFYYLRDRFGRVVECSKEWKQEVDELVALFPEHKEALGSPGRNGGIVSVVRYSHKDHGTMLFVPERANTVLARYDSVIDGELPYFVAERATLSDVPGGKFDEAIWIMYAKVIMAHYMFRAAERSINAPLVMPPDVGDIEEGIDAVMLTDKMRPGYGILPLSVPNQVFAYAEQLDQDTKEAAGYPDARTGGVKASIITGRGVEALMGTFDTQIKSAQTRFKRLLEDATAYCFKLDVKMWPNRPVTIEGITLGKSYKFVYTPAKDIGDNTACTVSYGFGLGNSPAQAMLMQMQLETAEYISKKTVRNNLPWPIDAEAEQQEIDTQRLNQAMMSGVAAYAQAFGVQIQQGTPADQVMAPLVKLFNLRQKGKALHEAIAEAFTPPEPVSGPEAGAAPGGAPAGEPGMGAGPGSSGLLPGVAAGQAGRPPGGLPDIMTMAAGLRGTNAQPNVQATRLTRRAV
jgi:hypothetical protein